MTFLGSIWPRPLGRIRTLARSGATFLAVAAISVVAVVAISGCGDQGNAISACRKGSESSDPQPGGYAHFCGCVVPAYAKAGGDLKTLTEIFTGEERGTGTKGAYEDIRAMKQLDRSKNDRLALKAARKACHG